MPRYSFSVDDGRAPSSEVFFDLTDLADAKAEAIRTAGEVLSDIGIGTVWDGVPWSLTVRDEQRDRVIEICFTIKCSLNR